MEVAFYYVYVIRSQTDHGLYIGYSTNVFQRLAKHNRGENTSTLRRRPFELIYFEAYRDKMDALGRERFLKSGSGRKFLAKQLKHFLEHSV